MDLVHRQKANNLLDAAIIGMVVVKNMPAGFAQILWAAATFVPTWLLTLAIWVFTCAAERLAWFWTQKLFQTMEVRDISFLRQHLVLSLLSKLLCVL